MGFELTIDAPAASPVYSLSNEATYLDNRLPWIRKIEPAELCKRRRCRLRRRRGGGRPRRGPGRVGHPRHLHQLRRRQAPRAKRRDTRATPISARSAALPRARSTPCPSIAPPGSAGTVGGRTTRGSSRGAFTRSSTTPTGQHIPAARTRPSPAPSSARSPPPSAQTRAPPTFDRQGHRRGGARRSSINCALARKNGRPENAGSARRSIFRNCSKPAARLLARKRCARRARSSMPLKPELKPQLSLHQLAHAGGGASVTSCSPVLGWRQVSRQQCRR